MSVGALRVKLVTACAPHVSDLVVAGHDRDAVGVLVLLSPGTKEEACQADLLAALTAHNAANPGNSTRVARALVLADPPSIDRGEITDKGYINQRAVLTHREDKVAEQFALTPSDKVLVVP